MSSKTRVVVVGSVLLAILAGVAVWRVMNPTEHPVTGGPTSMQSGSHVEAPADGPTLSLDLGDGVMLELVRIPAGSFMMGSPESEADRDSGEGPQHKVTIAKPFYAGKYEVTQAQFVKMTSPKKFEFSGDKLPAEELSWAEAAWFCDNASKKTGRKVRLPTEAEWEYFARAGTTGPFWVKGDLTPKEANFGQLPGGPAESSKDNLKPVGSYAPNAFGLYDTIGNVAEWCQDTISDDYAKAPTDGSATVDKNPDTFRVYRGGAYNNNAGSCRAAMRSAAESKADRNTTKGFRVVVE